ncbi:MAG TPA: cadherin repeat domain-containing protein, partial [Candidatus Sulfopaludibacter sp.]|nr:cadherin repeat domain-containing protein [Candidatus Sulfopaludibacter sp.]
RMTWRPTIAQSEATYSFSIIATDNGSPRLSATQYVLVTVLLPATPTIISPTFTNGVNGDSGPDYYIDSTTNLGSPVVWLPLFTNYGPTAFPLTWSDITATNTPQRFYRIRLGP